jgi:hypothetical protein
MIAQLQSLTRPAFALTEHLQRSAEVSAFDLTKWVKPRQTVNVVRSTCAKLRRVL